jgi:ribulose-5-phosphate 4-epimerase/fuculose-1-phosphate aldolase
MFSFSQAKASSMLALNEQNEVVEGKGKAERSAACIHRGVHNLRDDAKCVIHTHAPYSAALGMSVTRSLRFTG